MPRPTHNTASRGVSLAAKLARGKRNAERAPRAGARDLPILRGVTPAGVFTQPQENVLAEARGILSASGRLYGYGNTIVMDMPGADGGRLATVTNDGRAESSASSLIANLMICEHRTNQVTLEFPPPRPLVELLVNSEPTCAALPRIETYANRPIFDGEYRFLGNGWHPDAGVLVHGLDVAPLLPPLVAAGDARSRLPRHLRQLLSGFCFMADADVVNAVGAMLDRTVADTFPATRQGADSAGRQPAGRRQDAARPHDRRCP